MARPTLNEKLDNLSKVLEDGLHNILDEINGRPDTQEPEPKTLTAKLSQFGRELRSVVSEAPSLIRDNPKETIAICLAVVAAETIDGIEEAVTENAVEPNSVDLNTVRL
jgi:hypothetical protein